MKDDSNFVPNGWIDKFTQCNNIVLDDIIVRIVDKHNCSRNWDDNCSFFGIRMRECDRVCRDRASVDDASIGAWIDMGNSMEYKTLQIGWE